MNFDSAAFGADNARKFLLIGFFGSPGTIVVLMALRCSLPTLAFDAIVLWGSGIRKLIMEKVGVTANNCYGMRSASSRYPVAAAGN
jgi:hypothetical protein